MTPCAGYSELNEASHRLYARDVPGCEINHLANASRKNSYGCVVLRRLPVGGIAQVPVSPREHLSPANDRGRNCLSQVKGISIQQGTGPTRPGENLLA